MRDSTRQAANDLPLSPIGFLDRAALVYPDRASLIHGQRRDTWRETAVRCRQLASALVQQGIERGDVVAIIAPNIPALYESHFAVPMAGATLLALNTRLDADTTAYILDHSQAKVLFCDREFSGLIQEALKRVKHAPVVIDIEDALYEGEGKAIGIEAYEDFLAKGDPQFEPVVPNDK